VKFIDKFIIFLKYCLFTSLIFLPSAYSKNDVSILFKLEIFDCETTSLLPIFTEQKLIKISRPADGDMNEIAVIQKTVKTHGLVLEYIISAMNDKKFDNKKAKTTVKRSKIAQNEGSMFSTSTSTWISAFASSWDKNGGAGMSSDLIEVNGKKMFVKYYTEINPEKNTRFTRIDLGKKLRKERELLEYKLEKLNKVATEKSKLEYAKKFHPAILKLAFKENNIEVDYLTKKKKKRDQEPNAWSSELSQKAQELNLEYAIKEAKFKNEQARKVVGLTSKEARPILSEYRKKIFSLYEEEREMMRKFEKGLKNRPSNAGRVRSRSNALRKSKRPSQLNRSANVDCDHKSDCYNKGMAALRYKKTAKAKLYFIKSCELGQKLACSKVQQPNSSRMNKPTNNSTFGKGNKVRLQAKSWVPYSKRKGECNDPDWCYSLALNAQKSNDRKAAIKYFKMACDFGQPNGCIRYKRLK
jgi:hypothetical protein